jgi:hypothetical protein
MTNITTPISDRFLQQIWDFLNRESDLVVGGNDPAQEAEPNDAMQLLAALDLATDGEFAQ